MRPIVKKRFLLLASLGLLVLAAGATLAFRRNIPIFSRGKRPAEPAAAEPKASGPVLVELFTSEGCSSCPPADEVLSELVKAGRVEGAEVVALEEHVDYWNHLGWADPYSSAQFSARQEKYSSVFGNDQVYTPQMIIDGQNPFVGSDLGKARAAISEAAGAPKATVEISQHPVAGQQVQTKSSSSKVGFSVSVTNVPAARNQTAVDVLLAVTEDGLSSSVSTGENGGRHLLHDAVVRKLTVIGTINPEDVAFSAQPSVDIPGKWNRKALHGVVFVQERSTRRVLGAASVNLAVQ